MVRAHWARMLREDCLERVKGQDYNRGSMAFILKQPRIIAILPVILLAGLAGIFSPALPQSGTDAVHVIIQTEIGELELALDARNAPVTTANFLRYVDGGFYNGGRFHRTVTPVNQPNNQIKIEVIQAGTNPARSSEGFPPIQLERTNKTGIRHLDGTISMGRLGPDTATSDFFICLGDQPSLDFGGLRNPDGQGFAAFGRVMRGMDLVRKIQKLPADGQNLTPPIKIIKAFRKS
jgi:peptidyl-prolyl cis-trans isomerase A (cyclophilin A)